MSHYDTISQSPILSADAAWEYGCWISWYNSVVQDARNPSQLRLYYSLYCTEPAVRHPTTNSTLIASALSVAVSTLNM